MKLLFRESNSVYRLGQPITSILLDCDQPGHRCPHRAALVIEVVWAAGSGERSGGVGGRTSRMPISHRTAEPITSVRSRRNTH